MSAIRRFVFFCAGGVPLYQIPIPMACLLAVDRVIDSTVFHRHIVSREQDHPVLGVVVHLTSAIL